MDVPILLFLGISAVVIMTPGQDTALSLRNSMAGGRAAGLATALGVAMGQLVWAISAALGLVAVLAAAEGLIELIRYAGAAFLIGLGVLSLRSALTSARVRVDGHAIPVVRRISMRRAFAQGLLSNLGNPKMAVFFASLLPQFVPDTASPFATMMGLGVVFCTMTLLWLSLYAFAVDWAGHLLRRDGIRRSIEGITGAALIGLGLRISLVER